MHPGLYIAVSGNIIQEEKLNTITNNLANANTPGFKKDRIAFRQYFLAAIGEEKTDLSPGVIHRTDNPFDLAIQGDGYFTIQTPQGIAFTRRGDFTLDKNRRLVTVNGCPVLGEKGPIVISSNSFTVNNEGMVIVDGKVIDKLKIVSFPENNLRRLGESLLIPAAGLSPVPAEKAEIWQGYLEDSNVNVVKEMANMIEVLRIYEACQKDIQTIDEATTRAINDVGNVRA